MRIGRDEPCPCGSGRKLKRCCGEGRERQLMHVAIARDGSGWSAEPVAAGGLRALMERLAAEAASMPPEPDAGKPCDCGSGRPRGLCHEARFGNHGTLLELAALEHAHDLAAHEPFLRAQGRELEAFAELVAPTLDEAGPTPPEVNEEGYALLGESERRRLGEWARRERPRAWRAIARDVSDPALAERAICIGAVSLTVADRRPRPRFQLELLDAERVADIPHHVVGCALAPGSVWSRLHV